MNRTEQLTLIKRMKALAETGLVYTENGYDEERYNEFKEISLRLMSLLSNRPLEQLKDFFMPQEDYPTVKVDVRGLVFNDDSQILMVKESVDGKWTIPGGWADIGDTPSEAIVKEIQEETGLQAEVTRLLAVYDKRCHEHPPQPFYVYKLGFLCKVIKGELNSGFDMNDVGWFSLDKLPALSKDRILKSQLEHLVALSNDLERPTYFD